MLQQATIDVNLADLSGNTPLHACADADNVEGLRLLLAHPGMGSLDTRDAGGRTPLMLAVSKGSLACARELVGVEGVDLDTRDGQGRSLEEVARARGSAEVERLIRDARRPAGAHWSNTH